MPAKESEKKNPVHQAVYWQDHCRDEALRKAKWKAGYGKFMVGKDPKYRETKENPLRCLAHRRLSSSYDADINIDLSDRFIQRHARVPQLFSHHNYPQLDSFQVELPARPMIKSEFDSHLRAEPKFEDIVPPLPKTENAKYGWLAHAPLDNFPGIGKPARRVGDLAKAIGLPYEAW